MPVKLFVNIFHKNFASEDSFVINRLFTLLQPVERIDCDKKIECCKRKNVVWNEPAAVGKYPACCAIKKGKNLLRRKKSYKKTARAFEVLQENSKF